MFVQWLPEIKSFFNFSFRPKKKAARLGRAAWYYIKGGKEIRLFLDNFKCAVHRTV
jgi:hypothetical protein